MKLSKLNFLKGYTKVFDLAGIVDSPKTTYEGNNIKIAWKNVGNAMRKVMSSEKNSKTIHKNTKTK